MIGLLHAEFPPVETSWDFSGREKRPFLLDLLSNFHFYLCWLSRHGNFRPGHVHTQMTTTKTNSIDTRIVENPCRLRLQKMFMKCARLGYSMMHSALIVEYFFQSFCIYVKVSHSSQQYIYIYMSGIFPNKPEGHLAQQNTLYSHFTQFI